LIAGNIEGDGRINGHRPQSGREHDQPVQIARPHRPPQQPKQHRQAQHDIVVEPQAAIEQHRHGRQITAPFANNSADHHAFDLRLGSGAADAFRHQIGDDTAGLVELAFQIETIRGIPIMAAPGLRRQRLARQTGARSAQPPQPGGAVLLRRHAVEHFARAEGQTVAAIAGNTEPGDVALHPA